MMGGAAGGLASSNLLSNGSGGFVSYYGNLANQHPQYNSLLSQQQQAAVEKDEK